MLKRGDFAPAFSFQMDRFGALNVPYAILVGDNEISSQANEQTMFDNACPIIEETSELRRIGNRCKLAVEDEIALISFERGGLAAA